MAPFSPETLDSAHSRLGWTEKHFTLNVPILEKNSFVDIDGFLVMTPKVVDGSKRHLETKRTHPPSAGPKWVAALIDAASPDLPQHPLSAGESSTNASHH